MVVAVCIAAWHFVFLRFGWVPILVASVITDSMNGFPLTSDPSNWFAYPSLILTGFFLALALYAFRVSLGNRPVFRDLLAEA